MASNPRPPVAKNQLDLLDMLSQYGVKPEDRKAATSVARFPTAKTQYDLHQALASWNIDPGAREKYAQNAPVAPVEPTQPKAEGRAGLMGGLLNIVGKVAANPVGKVVGKVLDTAILKPLLIADTGRRAVISGIREGVDAFDGDDTTKASWGDFAKQAKDFNTGFGNTFTLPEGKWRGRIIGFLGDVLLDPLTYATLGGTVAKKAIVKSLSAGGPDVLTRSILGKTMHGAKGRQALGDLAYDRLKHFQKIGTKLDGKTITDSMIGQVTKDVTLQGKRKLPGLVADDIGLRGPGLYYFGSRVKVVGTEPIGWLLDKGLTGVRTGLVKPRSIKIGGQLRQVSPTAAIHAATVATGHGRVAQFGPDGIYHARMKLANGTATAAEAPYLLETVRAFEFSRGKVSGAIENAANMFENDVYKSGTEPFHKTVYGLLEGVRSRALASPEELAFADRLRYAFNFLSDITDDEFKKVDSGWVKRHTNDYFPRIRTQAFNEWQEANPQVANQFNLQNLTVDQLDQYRLAKSAKGRQLDVGEPWFGSYLTAKDLNIDSLNAIARSKTGGIDVFETDIRVVTAAYSRRYGEHLGMSSMMQHMKKRGPEFLAEWNKAIPSTLTGVTPYVGGPQTKLQNIKKNMAAQVKPKVKPKRPVVSSQPAGKTKSKITVAAEAAKVQIDETRTMVDASVEGHKEFVSLTDEFTSELENQDGFGTAHVMFGATEKHLSDSVDTLVEQQALLDSMSDDALAHLNGQVDEQLARMATLLEAHRQKVEYAANRLADLEDVSDVLPKPRDVIGTTMSSRNMDEPVKVAQQARVRGVDALQTLDDVELYLKELNPFGKMSPSVIAFQSGMRQDAKRIKDFLLKTIVDSDKATGRTRSLLDESVRNPKTPMGKLFARQKAIDINTTFGAFNAWMGFQDIIFRFKMENDITKLSANGFHAGAYLKQYDLAFEHNSRELLQDLYREQQNIIQQIRELPADTLVSQTFVKTANPDILANSLIVADLRKRIDLDTEFVAELLQETGGVPTLKTEELLKTIERRKKMVSSMLKGKKQNTTVVGESVYKPDFRKHYLETYLSKIEDRISSFTDTVNNHPVKVEPVTLPSTGPSAVEELAAQSASSATPQGRLSVLKAKVTVAKEARRIARAAAVVEATKNFPPKVRGAFNDFRKTVLSRMLYLEQHGKALQRSARTAEDIIYAIEKRVEAMKEFKSVGQVVDVSESFVTEQGDRMVVSNAVTDLADAVGYEDPEAIVYMNKVAEMRRQHDAALAEIRNLEESQPERYIREAREIGLKYNEENIPFGPDGITIRSVRDEVARLDANAVAVLREASNLSDRLEHRLMQSFVDSAQGSQLINDWLSSRESMVPGISAKAEISRAIDVLDFAEKEFISGPDAPAQQIINEMMDNDYYPFAKSIERHLNVMHELSDFDMSKFIFSDGMPINASFEQWATDWPVAVDDLKKKSALTTLTGGVMDWLKNPETAKIVLSADDFKQFVGDGMSDESLIQRFGDWMYRTQPQTLRSKAERDFARVAITEAWEASDARPFLNQIKVLKEDVLQATRSRRSARALDLADSYLMNADTLEARRADALANIVPWTAEDKAAWNKAQKSFYGSGVNIKESIRELAEGKVVGTGEVRLSDASMKRVDTVLQAVAEGKLKVPGFFKMMAKRRLSTQPMTVEELIPLIGREANGNIVDKETGDLLYEGFDNLDDEAVSTLDIATSVDTQSALEPTPTVSDGGYSDYGWGQDAKSIIRDEESIVDAANTADAVSTDSTMVADDVASGEMGTMSLKDLELQTIVNYINGVEDGTMNLLVKRNADIEHLVSVLNSPIETKSIGQLRHERKWIEDYIKRQSTIKNDRDYARIELAVERRLFESNGYNPVGALNLRESRLRFLTGKGMVTKQEVTARRRAIAVTLAESRKAAKVTATMADGATKRAAKEAAKIKSFPLHVREVFDVFSTMEDTLKTLVLDNDDKAVYWGLYGDNFGDRKAILNNVQRGQIEQWLNQLTEKRADFLRTLGKTKFANSFEFEEFTDGVKKLASWAQTIENRLAQVPSTDSFGKLAVTKGRPDVSDYGWSKKLVAMYNVQGDLLPDYPEFTSRWKPATAATDVYPRTQMYVPPADEIPEVLPHRFGPRDPDGMTLDLTAGTVAPVKQGEVTPQQLSDGGSFVSEKVTIQPAVDGASMPTTVSKTRVGDVAGVDEVYIGRKFGGYDSSKWHNPFTVAKTKGATVAEKTAAHQEAVDAYRTYLLANPELLKDLPELRGKKLLCWCDPLPCHGNVLKELLEQADNAGGVLASEVVPVTAIPMPPIPMEATQVARGYSPIGMATQPSVDDLVYTMAQMKKVKSDLTLQQVKEFTIAYRVFQEALDSGQPLTPDNLIKLAHTNAALESLRLTVGMTPEAVDDALIKGAMSAIDNTMPPIAPETVDFGTGEIMDLDAFRGIDDEGISTLGPAPVAPVATPPRIGPPRPAGVPTTPTPVRPVKGRRPIVPSTRKPVGVTLTPMPTPRAGGPKGPPPPRVRGGTPAAAFGPGKIPPRTPRQVMAQGMIEMEGMFPNLWMNPVIHEMWENAASFEVPKYAKHLKDTIGQFTTFHKTYSTATPGFHVRNGLANMVQLIVAGVNPKNMSEASKIYYGWLVARRQGTSYGDYLSTLTNAVQRRQASIARNALHLSGGGIFTESFHTTYKGGKLIDNPVTSKLLTLGRESDDYSRFVMGYDSAQKGYGSTPAAARIQRWFFDYEDISKLDMLMKEIVPFWLWTSRNLTLHLQNVWLDPRPYQVYNHFVRNFRADEGHPPPFVDEIGGWKLPFGNNLYATPDVNFNRVPQQVAEIKSGTRYLQNLNPVFRVPLEQALGRNLYNDKEMEGAQQRLVHILQGFVPPVKYADRLLNTEGEQQENALRSFLGSPIKQYGGG